MKRTLAAISFLAIIGALLVTPGVALGDQAMHTEHASFVPQNGYELENGFVVVTHMSGPVNFEKKEFQLHGAKPNSEFWIYRQSPSGTAYAGDSIVTDDHGNGHIITKLAADNPQLQALCAAFNYETISFPLKNLLYDGAPDSNGGPTGTLAYSNGYTSTVDCEWAMP